MNSGIIYVLTNPSFPDYVKIGYADNLEKRLRQLNKSECLPFAFRAYCIYEVDGRLKDKDVHNLIDKLNPGLRAVETFDGKPRIREFYNISPEDAYEILYNIAAISGTTNKLRKLSPEGHEILDEKIASENNKTKNYSEKLLFENSLDSTIYLYKVLKEKILEIGQISCKPLKHYISYKVLGTNKNICTVSIGKTNLHITINIKKGNLIDNKSLCKDVSTASGWKPPGDYLLEINTEDMIDYAIYLIKQAIERKKIGHETYTEEYHTLHGSKLTVRLYKLLKEEILSLGDIYIEPLKCYIAFKINSSNKNICGVEIQKEKLKVTINLKKGYLTDPECLARDISQVGHWAPGDYRLEIDNEDMIDYATYLIKQAVEAKK